jgi:hypothetical protein
VSIHQIYFLQRADGLIKVGTTTNLKARLASLATSHGVLTLIRTINGGRLRERSLHQKFKHFHEYGEWFRPEGGALAALIVALDEGEILPVDQSEADGAWAEGEAALMDAVRDKVEAMTKARMDRTGLSRDAALKAITADHGFSPWFLWHLRKRSSTVSAYGYLQVNEAYSAELIATLDFLRAEIARVQDEAGDAELIEMGRRLDAIEAELTRRQSERALATKIEARKAALR